MQLHTPAHRAHRARPPLSKRGCESASCISKITDDSESTGFLAAVTGKHCVLVPLDIRCLRAPLLILSSLALLLRDIRHFDILKDKINSFQSFASGSSSHPSLQPISGSRVSTSCHCCFLHHVLSSLFKHVNPNAVVPIARGMLRDAFIETCRSTVCAEASSDNDAFLAAHA
jgi:hypothetical protein